MSKRSYTRSPSKFTSLKRLKSAQADQETSDSREYCDEELKAMIHEKENVQAMALVDQAQKRMIELANLARFNDLLGEIKNKKVIMFPINMQNERNF